MSDSDVKEENMKLDYLKNHKSEKDTYKNEVEIFSSLIRNFRISKQNFVKTQNECSVVLRFLSLHLLPIPEEIDHAKFLEEFPFILNSVKSSNIEGITLDLNRSNDLEALKKFSQFRHSKLTVVSLRNIPDACEDLKCFFVNTIPYGLENLFLNMLNSSNLDCKFYFYELREAISKTVKILRIFNFNISGTEFCSFMKSSKNIISICYQNCTILTDKELDFGKMQGCKIWFLSFLGCSKIEYSNWENNSQRCLNILSAIENCPSLLKSVSNK